MLLRTRIRYAYERLTFRAASERSLPYVMSGLLFGLSWPSYPYVRLEIFAWVWMVPLLLALRSVTSFGRFLRNVYFTMLLGCVFAMSFLIVSTTLGTVLGSIIAGAVFTVPLVGLPCSSKSRLAGSALVGAGGLDSVGVVI